MANATASRSGQINGAGDDSTLFLDVYAGEVLASFQDANVTLDKHLVRTIEHGKSATFPVIGKKTASYHTPGAEITGAAFNHNEKKIIVDDLLVSSSFIADIDEARVHYDVRTAYSFEDGRALAAQMDQHVLQVGVLAARTTAANVTGGDAGSVVTEAAASDFQDPTKLAEALFGAAQTLDEKNIPAEDRYAFLRPAEYYTLVQSEKAINRDFGGEGAYSDGTVFRVAGMTIVKTTHLPNANITTGTVAAGTSDKYLGDFTKTAGLVMHKSAVGTVKLMDLSTESDYDLRRQGTLIVAKYAVGHGVLRPESAVELALF
ncbi:MAG: phage capsid protein [Neomegalonema sp.]|nr:phage capsid protein [Neomegalonema sp.]